MNIFSNDQRPGLLRLLFCQLYSHVKPQFQLVYYHKTWKLALNFGSLVISFCRSKSCFTIYDLNQQKNFWQGRCKAQQNCSWRLHDKIPNAKIPNVPKYPMPLYPIYSLWSFRVIIRLQISTQIYKHIFSLLVASLIPCSVVIVSYQVPRAAEAWPWPARHGQTPLLNIMLNNRSDSLNVRIKYWVYFGYFVTLGILALGILSWHRSWQLQFQLFS